MDRNEKEFTVKIEYFKSLREEIHVRIKENTQLVWIKMISIGVILSFLMEKFYVEQVEVEIPTSLWFYLIWIIPIIAIIFDFMLAGNLRDINNLGVYIRDHIEQNFREYLDDCKFRFWEECVAQADPKYHCYTMRDMVVIWLFTVASFIFSALVRWQVGFHYFIDTFMIIICLLGLYYAIKLLYLSMEMEREFMCPEICNTSNIKWEKASEDCVLISRPSLETSGYKMNFVYMPPKTKYNLEASEVIICVLRGSIASLIWEEPFNDKSSGLESPLWAEESLTERKSLNIKKSKLLISGESGCLLFICRDEGDNKKYFDDISGVDVRWSKFDEKIYRTIPQIYVGGYRVNLWYLGSGKERGIHNHSNEPVPFVEFHTQLRGGGWMVKYKDEGGMEETGRIPMKKGVTHDLFCTVKNKKIKYPWHQYITEEEESLFIVFEDISVNKREAFLEEVWKFLYSTYQKLLRV